MCVQSVAEDIPGIFIMYACIYYTIYYTPECISTSKAKKPVSAISNQSSVLDVVVYSAHHDSVVRVVRVMLPCCTHARSIVYSSSHHCSC